MFLSLPSTLFISTECLTGPLAVPLLLLLRPLNKDASETVSQFLGLKRKANVSHIICSQSPLPYKAEKQKGKAKKISEGFKIDIE